MDIRRMFKDPTYCTEVCEWLMEKASTYLLQLEALMEKDRHETVSYTYTKRGQDLSPYGYYHPGFFTTIVTKAVRGKLYKEKPESYAYEYHLNQDKSFISIHNGPLTENPCWYSTSYYLREKDFEFGFSIAKRKKANKQIIGNLTYEWCIGNVIYAKKGATEADTEVVELLCSITAQNKDYDGIRAEFCDKIDENLFTCYQYHLDFIRGKRVQLEFSTKVQLNKQGKLKAVNN